ncbi:MAG: hypothetical protein U0359_04010 [Byssovorax sp.]
MRACAVTNALTAGLLGAAIAFGACAGGQTTPAPTPAATTAGPSDPSNPVPTTAVSLSTSAPLVDVPKKPPPSSAADCKVALSELVNVPPSNGVVMNNAMTTVDAGAADRFQPMTEIIKSKNDAFRCCFDLWSKNHREAAGREVPIKLVINLKPDGTLVSSSIDPDASQLDDPEVTSCMIDLTKALTYPRSSRGMDTKFTYTFFFKVRR